MKINFTSIKSIATIAFVSLLCIEMGSLVQSCSKSEHTEQDQTTGNSKNNEKEEGLIRVNHDPNYLGDQTCKTCHQTEFKDWENSHHDKAMAHASDSSVRGDFNGVVFESRGVTSKFFKKDGKFMVNTEGPDGKNHDYEISYTFGYEPLQQYIVAFPNGHFQCLRTAWDTEKKVWFDLYPDLDIDPREWIHWTKGGLNWNTMCSDCHSTNVKKNYDNKTSSFDSEYSIINVSCEACHGPGKKHVEFMQSGNFKEGSKYHPEDHLHLTSGLSSIEQVDQCARCHARRTQYVDGFDHNGVFMDYYAPQIIGDEFYHPDGQILDEDYVFGSFTQSKMYHNGVKCTDCHNPHSLELKAKGNQLCLQCHAGNQYDTKNHHFHEGENESTECVNCHMTGKTYMGNDFRRDHSFRIPRPDQSIEYNTPNACTQCHEDKSDEWAVAAIEKWYGKKRDPHFSDALTKGSTRSPEAMGDLVNLLQDTQQPAIARATALWYLGQLPNPEIFDPIVSGLSDHEPIVRYTAARVLMILPPEQKKQLLTPLLSDSIKSVRAMAAGALAEIPINEFEESVRGKFTKAMQEYSISLSINADFPAGQMAFGQYFDKINQPSKAEQAYKKANELDYLFNPSRIHLANLYNSQGKNEDALALFQTVIQLEPEYGPAYYSTGLLLAEMKRLDEAVEYLGKAAKLVGNNPRIYYNWGLALQNLNRIPEAEVAFLEGLKVDPNLIDLDYALTILYLQQQQFAKAKPHAEKLLAANPNQPQFQQFMQTINTNLK
ncbi:tetratricopeptide repeat protein [Flexithrix dorotheae]|uniref:tetratricopeptide repeat protein n=1 Tax=Flexithrix dorotheae TaxID=70993 RepID=UPI00037A6D41|nr:tetratricopeptide repeat protein [Flexithrix dorotheae]